jgi:hypothetical protein
VIEAVYSSDGEGEFLPFWRLYIEQNYRGEWVCVGKFLLRERGGRSHIVHRYPNGLEATLLDGLCAQTVGTTLEGFRDAMTHGSVEERLELLKRFVERSRGALDSHVHIHVIENIIESYSGVLPPLQLTATLRCTTPQDLQQRY